MLGNLSSTFYNSFIKKYLIFFIKLLQQNLLMSRHFFFIKTIRFHLLASSQISTTSNLQGYTSLLGVKWRSIRFSDINKKKGNTQHQNNGDMQLEKTTMAFRDIKRKHTGFSNEELLYCVANMRFNDSLLVSFVNK